MADVTYTAESRVTVHVVTPFVLAAIFAAGAGGVIGSGNAYPAAFALALACVFVGAGIHSGWYMPTEATLTDAGVVLRARARKIIIPWGELWGVRLQDGTLGRHLRWEYGSGKVCTTLSFNELTTLLAEMHRRSPGTRLP